MEAARLLLGAFDLEAAHDPHRVAAQRAFAASLLELPPAADLGDGPGPELHELLAEVWLHRDLLYLADAKRYFLQLSSSGCSASKVVEQAKKEEAETFLSAKLPYNAAMVEHCAFLQRLDKGRVWVSVKTEKEPLALPVKGLRPQPGSVQAAGFQASTWDAVLSAAPAAPEAWLCWIRSLALLQRAYSLTTRPVSPELSLSSPFFCVLLLRRLRLPLPLTATRCRQPHARVDFAAEDRPSKYAP
ncbi:hypothetical protein AK812_SmicGene25513 [Symbiodinium microadriaticum]|uniref:Uncharacterized protein n=1 Tax=Symbiodinium microadriaticum TaxID=2951 RepID=A0A1Q9DBP4_SYMMI|nr:hypothetical protein AK812_SmicGene25513 [Symbiodinium microadriaticum]